MINKQQSFEIYKILIANDASHINGKSYGKDLARLAITLVDAFDEAYLEEKTSKNKELREILETI